MSCAVATDCVETERLLLRRPRWTDIESIFSRYASDPEVTRYLSWPTHRSLAETREFLALSDSIWEKSLLGPYLIFSRSDGGLLGGTGLSRETSFSAATGYVLARDAWGHGYAAEALQAMVSRARAVGIRRLYALCHTDHRRSWRVLEKCSFEREGLLRSYVVFPNLVPGEPLDVYMYARIL